MMTCARKSGRIILTSIAVALAISLCGCGDNVGKMTEMKEKETGVLDTGKKEDMKNTYRQITMAEAVIMMQEESDYILLDVRRPDEFAEGHIPNAINVANETIGTEEIPELPDKDQLIMVYCRSGRRSKEASEKLVKLGYTNIVEFGGILDWTGEIVK